MENIECSMNKIIIFSLFIRGYGSGQGSCCGNGQGSENGEKFYGFIENMYYVRMRNERK